MIIDYRKGNAISIFLNDPNVHYFAHGCNIQKTMGAGIAKEVKLRLPELYEADQRTEYNNIQKLGVYTTAHYPGDKVAYNLYTQHGYGTHKRMVCYDSLAGCFQWVNLFAKLESRFDPVLVIPRIGAGLAGGDWSVIEHIINNTTPNLDVIVIDFDGSK